MSSVTLQIPHQCLCWEKFTCVFSNTSADSLVSSSSDTLSHDRRSAQLKKILTHNSVLHTDSNWPTHLHQFYLSLASFCGSPTHCMSFLNEVTTDERLFVSCNVLQLRAELTSGAKPVLTHSCTKSPTTTASVADSCLFTAGSHSSEHVYTQN